MINPENERIFLLCFVVVTSMIVLNIETVFADVPPFSWMSKKDNLNRIKKIFKSVQDYNCKSKSKAEMVMRDDVVTQLPKANELRSKVFYKNRTKLVHLHNMALNRAYFMSYILQKMNSSESYPHQPNIHYLYMSVTADVNAHPYSINGSSIIFDKDCYYPNWLTHLDFNNTIPLFGVKGWRIDNTFDQTNFVREPNRRVAQVEDIGAGLNNNYTLDGYKMNTWYKFWLPDDSAQSDASNKYTYGVGIKYSNVTGKFINDEFNIYNFFGPNAPRQNLKDDSKLPVRFTVPYFDCGKSNNWKVSAVAPIIDFFPRYSNYTHMRRQRFVGVVTMDIDLKKIDFNACGISDGNPGPSYMAGVNRCKPNTGCKHKSGRGLGRGGYTCHCKNKYFYPMDIQGPYDGKMIEKATYKEYQEGFDCIKGNQYRVLPVVDQNSDVTVEFGIQNINTVKKRSLMSYLPLVNGTVQDYKKNMIVDEVKRMSDEINGNIKSQKKDDKIKSKKRRKRTTDFAERSEFDQMKFNRMMRIFRQKVSINKDNCKQVPPSSLNLPGDAAYDVENQFKYQGTTALRLSHFLSLFLENVQISDNFGSLSGGGRLHQDHLFGEVIANVMADHRIFSSGIFFEPYIFENVDGSKKELFGPYAYKRDGVVYAIDMAGLPKRYTHETWYTNIKSRWKTNTAKLKKYGMKQMVRSDPNGTSSVKFEYYPINYYAPKYEDGMWSNPIFKCDDMVNAWVVTYSVPFFRRDYIAKRNRFAGVITVDIPLDNLEINQCPQPFSIANAFKNTARCHSRSTKCKVIPGYKYSRGAYRCNCKQGYEYQFADGKHFIEGNLVELEYEKRVKGLFSRFDSLVCRVQGSALRNTTSNILLFIVVAISLTLLNIK